MSCLDIIFPINLGPLTYRCPDILKDIAAPGMIVSAQLKNRITKGVVFRKNSAPPAGHLKEIVQVHGETPVFSKGILNVISWMSDYYLAPEGLILKLMFPRELFARIRPKTSSQPAPVPMLKLFAVPETSVAELTASIAHQRYQTFLIHASSSLHEYSLARTLLQSAGNAIVILPEIRQASLFYEAIKKEFSERACLLHSDMPAGKRSVTIDGIISGRHDIVIGTRTALLAPLKKLSFMMVLHEHSSSYKIEEGVRFNTRDVAVMRGFIEKIPVMLTSPVPSIDSWFNAQSGKYRPLALEPTVQRPKIKIVDMRFSKKVKPYLSKALVDAAKKYLQKAERIMFVINRRGHSTMLLCAECGSTEKCTACGIPLVLHKDRNLVRCHYCGKSRSVPESCSTCKSPNLSLLGAGTQKIEEDMRELFGMEPLRFDSDRAKRKTAIRQLVDEAALDASKIMIGTKMMTRHIGPSGSFSLAGMLTIDGSLNIPDFRAREKTYSEITDLLDLVGPQGEIIIQTRFPQEPLFRHIRDNDYETFAREELSMRKAMNFPPYSRLLNVLVSGNAAASDTILKIVHESARDIEVLGPIERKTKKGAIESSILLKSRDRKALHAAARSVLETFRNAKDIEIRIDVDPQ